MLFLTLAQLIAFIGWAQFTALQILSSSRADTWTGTDAPGRSLPVNSDGGMRPLNADNTWFNEKDENCKTLRNACKPSNAIKPASIMIYEGGNISLA
ncbi:hypothetical protein [Ferruginibacter sp.]|uniref:hypothetical protein n=1 Tax=Ferruginibacter sp. TaxID=1940288 RepID=UPI0026596E41|nr:hypothetical protein [Ferruginibacter sp.]